MIRVALNNERGYPVAAGFIKKLAEKAAKMEKKIRGEVEINIVDNNEIKKLNRKWRGVNAPTDVLSFSWEEDKTVPAKLLGQIVVSYPKIVVQAKEFGVPVKEELGRMIAHGLLHLAGHEHASHKSAKKMFTLQESILCH